MAKLENESNPNLRGGSDTQVNLNARVLAVEELEEILEYEGLQLEDVIMEEAVRMTAAWNAKWRREALDFYLPMGWSFAIRDENEKLQGYFLAQPLLFFRSYTQTLWIEQMSYTRPEVAELLIELAVKWGRDKHLQRVLFADFERHRQGFLKISVNQITENIGEVKTVK